MDLLWTHLPFATAQRVRSGGRWCFVWGVECGDILEDWEVGAGDGIEPVTVSFLPHLPRTCAKLCRKNGGKIEQIKFLLGHSSIQTTERYLGSEQEIEVAVNDNLGL
ncbi:hypothetical protein [Granulicella mallensis]|uniref:Integrase family protein n=1 Tax=Granulicella mallensis TaxID=940614 RepID=A0A7W8E7Z2_9BACT|nr:hypothetical protein [Granulicella mallensis]MBB5062237.1 hypothetical protein [Granulicella mallensis]